MNEALTIKTERVDDIPLLLAQMQRMGLVELLERHFPTHGNRVGLNLGWVTALWLTHVLSQADHRMNRVQVWAQQVGAARAGGQPLIQVERTQADGQSRCIAQGYEHSETITAQLDGVSSTWTERRLLVQSLAAQQALSELTVRRQGKVVLCERVEVEQAVTATLAHFRVEGLLLVTVSEQVQEQAVRAYRHRPATTRITRQFTITSQLQPQAVRKACEQLGWRVYATNQTAEVLAFAEAVEAYRDEFLVERNFGRLKGRPLSLSPMYVERDDHATGLVRVLSIALRVLTLLQFVVRRHLSQQGASLAGLYAGNPKRATTQPTTERLLEAFQEIFLTIVLEPHQTRRHLTALSALQQRVLALLEFSPTIYSQLCEDSSEPP